MPDNSTGKLAEDFTSDYLLEHGYEIVARNYHSRFGEIDIIAKDKDFIVFVEVKARKKNGLTNPFEAVTKSKQVKIIKTAQLFLLKNNFDLQPRFDVAAVHTIGQQIESIDYIRSAFGLN